MSEFQALSIVRAVAELAEDRANLMSRVRHLEAVNVELQQEVERWRTAVKALEPKAEA
jgi:hypothetical protein